MNDLRRAWYHATDGGRLGAATLAFRGTGGAAMLLLFIAVFLSLEPTP